LVPSGFLRALCGQSVQSKPKKIAASKEIFPHLPRLSPTAVVPKFV
jgi:hypothetical protein